MFLGVALGAFGAHGLKGQLSERGADIFKTAVLYHLVHAVGLFAVAWLSTLTSDVKVTWAGYLLVAGIALFSGSLYILAVSGIKWLGAITPLGGLAFMAAWLLVAFASTEK